MSKELKNKEEFTDVRDSAISALNDQNNPTTKKPILSKNAKFGIASAAILLGGSAFAFNLSNTGTAEGSPMTPVKPDEPAKVENGTIHPNENVEVATGNFEDMSFKDAFDAAREEVGTGGIFNYHGKVYNTFTEDEWDNMPISERQEFLHDLGFKVDHVAQHVSNGGGVTPPIIIDPIEPDIREVVINGENVIAIDENRDGQVDCIVIKASNGEIVALTDSNGDGTLDLANSLDPETGDIIYSEDLPNPSIISMAQVEAIDETFITPIEQIDEHDGDETVIDEHDDDDEVDVTQNNEDFDNDISDESLGM